jgi:hypothetical protein
MPAIGFRQISETCTRTSGSSERHGCGPRLYFRVGPRTRMVWGTHQLPDNSGTPLIQCPGTALCLTRLSLAAISVPRRDPPILNSGAIPFAVPSKTEKRALFPRVSGKSRWSISACQHLVAERTAAGSPSPSCYHLRQPRPAQATRLLLLFVIE